MEKEEDKRKFLEGLNNYFKMKSEYEETNLKNRKKIIKNPDLSWKEKRSEYKKLKPKCINCKRPVGTIFSNLYNPEESGRKLMAVCGDRTSPCPLNIIINLGETTTYLNDNDILEKEIIQLKNRIIKEKNDLIFGYISSKDAVNSFEDIKEDLNLTISNYELNLENYMYVTDNKDKNELIKKEQIAVYQEIQSIKELVSQYERNENVQLIRDAIEIYVNQLTPRIDKLNKLKFSYRAVVYDSDDDTHHFIQKQYTIDEIETNFSKHEVGVEIFQTGTKEQKSKSKSKEKPLKVTNAPPKFTIKPTLIVESDEEEEEEVPSTAPKEIDVNFVDSNGETYLFKAAKSGDIEKVREQIENGADIHKKTTRGETILYGAVNGGDLEVVTYLLDHGADSDINVKANWGFTPLTEATNKKYLEIVELLKNKGGVE
jgi:hypothetical protein